jgi:uncharacterized delta-60 repeat protein
MSAVSGGLTIAYSNSFDITPGVAATLAFLQQPGGGVADNAWAQQPHVKVLDTFGNTIITDNTTQVTLTISTNPGGGVLAGHKTLTVTNGVAVFTDLEIYNPGNGYTLSATSPNNPTLAPDTSAAFNITAPPAITDEMWANRYSNANEADRANDVVVDSYGNVYVTGQSYRSGTNYDFYTIKYDSAGNVDWEARYNNDAVNDSDQAMDIAVDAKGNAYVTGWSKGTGLNDDYLTLKYDSSGTEVWDSPARFNGSGDGDDRVRAISVDTGGNVCVTGYSMTTAGNYDYTTIKYDADGNTVWSGAGIYNGAALYHGGFGDDTAVDIAVDSSGNVYVTGSVYDGSQRDYGTVKYNSSGVEQWARWYDGTASLYDDAAEITIDDAGFVYVTGASQGGSTSWDWATIKYNSAGDPVWPGDGAVRYDAAGSNAAFGEHISVDSSGNVYVTGTYDEPNGTFATAKYDSAGNEQWVSRYIDATATICAPRGMVVDSSGNIHVAGTSYYTSYADYVAIKYDNDGRELWNRKFNGPSSDYDDATAIALDSQGNVFVTGVSTDSTTGTDFATVKYIPTIEEWVARYNGPENGNDDTGDIAVDSAGNIYVTGYSLGTGTDLDYITVKYNSAGVEQWSSRYDGPANGQDRAYGIAVDSSGNVYVTGHSDGIGGTYADCATIKYNSAGVEQWVRRYNGPGSGFDGAYDIAVGSTGNVYVTGRSLGIGTSTDYFTIKYNSGGVEQWVARYNGLGNSSDTAYAIVLDSSENVYITGKCTGTDASDDYATVMYNSGGVEQWASEYSGPGNDEDIAHDIVVDMSGNVFVTGNSYGSGTLSDYATIKYNSSGVEQWVQRKNGEGNTSDMARAITLDASGNVYVTGRLSLDYGTIKYDTDGYEQWMVRYNGPNDMSDTGEGMILDSSGNIYVTGYSRVTATDYDFATIKYDSGGNQQWVARYNGTGNDYDIVREIVLDDLGNVYITGNSAGSGTLGDGATIKYKR